MLTVREHLISYCQERQLPPPSKTDIESCGKLVSHHFKYYWGKSQENGVLVGFGFTIVEENDKKIVVIYYPEFFKSEMDSRIDIYFQNKNKPSPQKIPDPPSPPPSLPKKRKRIPIPIVTKAYSVKPSITQ